MKNDNNFISINKEEVLAPFTPEETREINEHFRRVKEFNKNCPESGELHSYLRNHCDNLQLVYYAKKARGEEVPKTFEDVLANDEDYKKAKERLDYLYKKYYKIQ